MFSSLPIGTWADKDVFIAESLDLIVATLQEPIISGVLLLLKKLAISVF